MNDTSSTSQETESPPENKPREKKNFPWMYVILIVLISIAFAAGLSAGYLVWGQELTNVQLVATEAIQAATTQAQVQATEQSSAQSAPSVPEQVTRYDIPVDDDPSIGLEDAPITIIEFSDYQCPYCQRWHDQVFSRLLMDYPEQVRIVYRDFPLSSIHPEALPAAMAANCAYEQDTFWEYHNKLFSGELPLGEEAYTQYAADVGLDVSNFEECLESERYAEEVQADFQFAANLGIGSTPTFFLNGIPIVGAQPYEVFQEVIELELAGEIP